MSKTTLIIASGNPNKVSEITEMLNVLNLEVKKQPDSLSVEETGKTYLENALLKARAASLRTNSWALADDSGLEVDFLEGKPGIFSARYAKNDSEKLKKLLNELGDTPYRSARLISCMVLCDPKGELVKETTGICWGEILKKPNIRTENLNQFFGLKKLIEFMES